MKTRSLPRQIGLITTASFADLNWTTIVTTRSSAASTAWTPPGNLVPTWLPPVLILVSGVCYLLRGIWTNHTSHFVREGRKLVPTAEAPRLLAMKGNHNPHPHGCLTN